ncbi:MAG: hypothetical protein RIM23_19605 [Coleofasciculus sp. G3-WIS-01]|uniref:hypothetical protein n=1 Tax=Coleofasciculus sp. G3-WIS-01 TaxID=3069528 RepID=UPI0032F3DD73
MQLKPINQQVVAVVGASSAQEVGFPIITRQLFNPRISQYKNRFTQVKVDYVSILELG